MSHSSDRKIGQEASAWVAKLHGANPSASELEAFHAWMARSPAHLAEVRRVAKLWEDLNVLTELSVMPEEPVDKIGRYSLFRARGFNQAFAGVVLFAIALVTVTLLQPAEGPEIYRTAVGEQQLLTLSDGSTVLLNTNSQVRIDYARDARNIYLSHGQAHFVVAHNPDRPLRVYSREGMVKAVGTAFSMYLKGAFLEVTVTEGSVELNSLTSFVESSQFESGGTLPAVLETLAVVKSGENIKLNQVNNTVSTTEHVDTLALSKNLAWHQGMITFSGESLQEVLDEVGRYTLTSIVVVDPDLRSLRVGGRFQVGETDKILKVLSENYGFKVDYIDDDLVHLSAGDTFGK